MNKLLLMAMAGLINIQSFAQTINASEVIKKIKSGQDVEYRNVTIDGIVDITPYEDEKDDLPRRSWFDGNDNTIEDTMRGKVTFVDCEFRDDFLAYYHDDRSEMTFVAHFEDDVVFKNCTFHRDAAFKYSEFREEADFSGTVFRDHSNFKYAEFSEESTFAGATFEEESDFKYAEFESPTDFSNTSFREEANFKYAEMKDGVKFTNAVFDGLWNLKYAEMDREVDLTGIQVNDDLDTKYTKINGRDFSRYLLSKNK